MAPNFCTKPYLNNSNGQQHDGSKTGVKTNWKEKVVSFSMRYLQCSSATFVQNRFTHLRPFAPVTLIITLN